MIRFFEHYSLGRYNTFGVEAMADAFFEFTEAEDLLSYLETNGRVAERPTLVLGGGSNLLLVDDFHGTVIFPNVPGIQVERENRSHIWVRVGAGVVWDDLVQYSVWNGWGGIENLSMIPGRVGASVVQNIGAYGQEVSSVVESVAGIHLHTGASEVLQVDDCAFAYRDSIFKHTLKGAFVVTSVLYRLDKFPELVLGYEGVAERVGAIENPTIVDVRDAVMSIRRSKLPDPKELGNAGSFFKNPVVSAEEAERLLNAFPEMPCYPSASTGACKLSAGWLIDRCGWKGFREGDAGVHKQHALVLVNYGKATGRAIFMLSEEIRQSVFGHFGVDLEREVLLVGLADGLGNKS